MSRPPVGGAHGGPDTTDTLAQPDIGRNPPGDAPDSRGKVGSDALVVGLGYLVSFAYPLVSLPFLARVLGVAELGHLMFALAVLQIVVQVTDFGFGMSALRRIAVARTRAERSHVVFSTLKATVLLWGAGAATIMTIVLLVPAFTPYWPMYAAGLALIGIGAMYPDWLLQGTGRIKAFAVLTACSRLVALVFLLLTVRGPDDMTLAMIWQQAPLALSALVSWVCIALIWHAVQPVRTTVADVREALADSWPLFVANLSAIVLGSSNAVVLGAVSTTTQVAHFGAAERFANAAKGVMRGVVDVMLPRMTRTGTEAARLQRSIMVGIIGCYTTAALTLILAAPWFIPWYLGEPMRDSVPVLQLLGLSLLMFGLTSALQLRATSRHRFGAVARLAVIGAGIHLVLLVPAAWLLGDVGAAGAVVVSETIIAAMYAADARRERRRRATPTPEEDS